MKNYPIFVLLFLCPLCPITNGFAQAAPREITLENHDLTARTNFVCTEIIDKRIVKSNIGFVRVGLQNRKILAWLKGDISKVIQDHINNMIVSTASPEQILILVNELNVGEYLSPFSEQAVCKVELEFVQKIDSSYYSLGIYAATNEEYGLDVTKFHSLAISKCLQRCIEDFVQSNWLRTAQRIKIDIQAPAPSYDYKSVPPAGGYDNFVKLVKNESVRGFDFSLTSKTMNSDVQRYKLTDERTRYEAGIVNFVSDGTSLYINASTYIDSKYYVKAKQLGRYIYFEDQFSNKSAAYNFGLIGTALTNKLRGLVLDTKNGEISILSDYHLLHLLENYPRIKEIYEKSAGQMREREAALMSLNNEYRRK